MSKKESDWAEDLFNDPTTEPKSFWKKFEKVGDQIAGELVMPPFDKEGKFGEQRIYVVRTEKGEEWNVALKHSSNKRQIQQLNDAVAGDLIAFRFAGTYDTEYGNQGKDIQVRIRKQSK